MDSILIKVLVNAVAIWVATAVVPGVEVSGDSTGKTVLTLVVVGAIFGVVNAIIKPVVKLFSLPFYILTLGLFAFVVNALMLELVAWLSDQLNISFTIDDFFWSAIGAAVVVTFVSMVLNLVLPDGD
ncbi:phage holin family protein [Kineosporia sp. J2-2]|uniref:Phage holin family protein n=1 Tax=Kineosporia corallincola TaxID=2835133 RepID=A0ABS5TJT6_9ACTN|nr:phage holin family protein [Kineosporia corallincola]MBT0771336.1 phage holin family protein [Kineosporia corallincola]